MIRVRVANLALDPNTDSPVVLLEGLDVKGVLPIWIGKTEATAIAFPLSGQTFERPLTHDLLRIVIEGFEASVKRVVITELRGNTFFAKIFLERGDEILSIDARPSDSIALALRTQAPIFVSQELFDRSSQEIETRPSAAEDDDEDDDDPLRRLLDDMEDPPDPSDP